MTRRTLTLVATLSAIVATLWLATGSAATQEGPAKPPTTATEFPLWDFPRTADGQPDIQGMWIPDEWGRPLETPEPPPETRAPRRERRRPSV